MPAKQPRLSLLNRSDSTLLIGLQMPAGFQSFPQITGEVTVLSTRAFFIAGLLKSGVTASLAGPRPDLRGCLVAPLPRDGKQRTTLRRESHKMHENIAWCLMLRPVAGFAVSKAGP